MNQLNTSPVISIIVPVYNVSDELLKQCIESILKQTYTKYELILVDDGTNDNNKVILKEYKEQYSKIKIITHEKNKGLFRARITGVQNASGSYILFVDADDHITIDWLRLLVTKSIEDGADITMGQFISEDENRKKTIYNLTYSYCQNRKSWIEKEIFEHLAEDEGRFFGLHVIWNKLYTKELWDKALPVLNRCDRHFIMTEDIAFSFVLFYYAKKMSFSAHDGYFYYRNAQSSTKNIEQISKVEKNVSDLIYCFTFIENFLKDNKIFDAYQKNLEGWKNRYFRFWSYPVKMVTIEKNNETQLLRKQFLEYFQKTSLEFPIYEDSIFVANETIWNSQYEELKEMIASERVKIISFDIFDTLVLRPVLEPDDLFKIIQYENPDNGKYNFYHLRKLSEEYCRQEEAFKNPQMEDITLEQIYSVMENCFGISHEQCEMWKNKEISYEITLSQERKTGKELYELANCLGKKIVLVSDMYLEREIVEKILEKNGYTLHKHLYLSSEYKKLKATKHLFNIMLDDSDDMCAENILHIGDNWNNDYIVPKSLGMQAYFLPKTSDILFNRLGDRYTGNSIGFAVDNRNSVIDLTAHLKKLPVRCLYAIVANEMFDNPFYSFNIDSDYNADPYFIGTFPVGIHMFGVAKWLLEKSNANYKTIHFTSRDGYYIKYAYDLMRTIIYPMSPPSDYIYVSRKSLVPIDIIEEKDCLSIINNIAWQGQSPISLLTTYAAVLKPIDKKTLSAYKKAGFDLNRNFSNEHECMSFLKMLVQISFSKEKAAEERKKCCQYLKSKLKPEDAIFDMGYSGKMQELIIHALGYPIDGYYIHHNGHESMTRAKNANFQIHAFYEFIPSMSGIINEFLLSDYHPSCIGYKDVNGTIEPKFDLMSSSYMNQYIVEEIARAALCFVSTVSNIFKDHMNVLQLQSIDTGLQYEKFLVLTKKYDKNLFDCCTIEDVYYGGIDSKQLMEAWDAQINDRKLFYLPQDTSGSYVSSTVSTTSISEESCKNESNTSLDLLYDSGLFISFYKKMNSWFPIGSKKRERLKKLLRIFIRNTQS